MRVNRLNGLAVKRSATFRAAERQTHGDGARDICTPEKGRGLIDDLVKTDDGKIGELHFDDRPHAFNRRADSHANHRVLADR